MTWFSSIKNDVAQVKKTYEGLGLVASFFSFFQGRATTFAIYFTIIGTILAFEHNLTGNFVAFVGAIQSLVIGHSLKEDWFQRRNLEDRRDAALLPAPPPMVPKA